MHSQSQNPVVMVKMECPGWSWNNKITIPGPNSIWQVGYIRDKGGLAEEVDDLVNAGH